MSAHKGHPIQTKLYNRKLSLTVGDDLGKIIPRLWFPYIVIIYRNSSYQNVWEYHWFIIMSYLVWNEYLHTYVRNPLMLRAIYQQKMLLHIRSCLILRILCFTPISSSLKHIWDKLLSPACNNYHCILISNQWWEILHDLLYLNLIQICSHAV